MKISLAVAALLGYVAKAIHLDHKHKEIENDLEDVEQEVSRTQSLSQK